MRLAGELNYTLLSVYFALCLLFMSIIIRVIVSVGGLNGEHWIRSLTRLMWSGIRPGIPGSWFGPFQHSGGWILLQCIMYFAHLAVFTVRFGCTVSLNNAAFILDTWALTSSKISVFVGLISQIPSLTTIQFNKPGISNCTSFLSEDTDPAGPKLGNWCNFNRDYDYGLQPSWNNRNRGKIIFVRIS